MLGIARRGSQELVWNLGDEFRLAGAQHIRHPAWRGRVFRVTLREIPRPLNFRRVDMGGGQPAL